MTSFTQDGCGVGELRSRKKSLRWLCGSWRRLRWWVRRHEHLRASAEHPERAASRSGEVHDTGIGERRWLRSEILPDRVASGEAIDVISRSRGSERRAIAGECEHA